MTLDQIAAQVINGLITGSTYVLVAGGLTLIWGTMRMLNFAAGEFFTFGAYGLFYLSVASSIPLWLGITLAVAIIVLLAMGIERTILHPLLPRPTWEIGAIVVTLGLSVFLQDFALHVFGERFKNVPDYVDGTVDLGVTIVANQRILILVVSVIVITGIGLLMKYSRLGFAIRATSQDAMAAELCGVNKGRTYMYAFGLAAGLAALAGVLIAPVSGIYAFSGTELLLKGFIVAVLGGLGSFRGAVVAGFALGVIESFGVAILSTEWKAIFGFALLIIVLVSRPWGLYGSKEQSA